MAKHRQWRGAFTSVTTAGSLVYLRSVWHSSARLTWRLYTEAVQISPSAWQIMAAHPLSQTPATVEMLVLDQSFDNASTISSATSTGLRHEASEVNVRRDDGQGKKRTRGLVLTDVWAAAGGPKEGDELRDKHGHRWFYCSLCKWKGAASDRIRTHLRTHNIRIDDAQPPAKKRAIERAIAGLPEIFSHQKAQQSGRDLTKERLLCDAVNKPAFLEALVQLISKHSPPLSLVEWPEFYALIASVNYMAASIVKTSRNQVPDLLQSSFLMHQGRIKQRWQDSLTWISRVLIRLYRPWIFSTSILPPNPPCTKTVKISGWRLVW